MCCPHGNEDKQDVSLHNRVLYVARELQIAGVTLSEEVYQAEVSYRWVQALADMGRFNVARELDRYEARLAE